MKTRARKRGKSREENSPKPQPLPIIPPKTSTTQFGWILILLLCIIILLAAWWYYTSSRVARSIPPTRVPEVPVATYRVTKHVQEIDWNDIIARNGQGSSLSIAQTILSQPHMAAVPLKLKNTPITSSWNAFRTWTPQFLSTQIPWKLKDVYFNTQRIFGPHFDPQRPLFHVGTVPRPTTHFQFKDLTGQQFFNRSRYQPQRDRSPFYYYSSPIENLSEELVDDLQPLDEILVDPDSPQQNINFWFGGLGSPAAHTHYDSYTNFNVQIYGRKRWILFSPLHSTNLHLFPFLHPSHAQVQLNILNHTQNLAQFNPLKRFDLPDASQNEYLPIDAYEVLLNAGEILYLPPCWFHFVEAANPHDFSISVNAWSYSSQSQLMQKVHSIEVPFGELVEQWVSSSLRNSLFQAAYGHAEQQYVEDTLYLWAVRQFLLDLSSRLHTFPLGDAYMQTLYESRYRTLVQKEQIPAEHPLCGDSRREMYQLLQSRVEKEFHKTQEPGSKYGKRYQSMMKEIEHSFRKLPRETLDIWLMNYMEFIAVSSLRNPPQLPPPFPPHDSDMTVRQVAFVGSFFKDCFSK